MVTRFKLLTVLEYRYLPISRVSRSQYASARRPDSLYSFMKRHPADKTPEAKLTKNEKTKKLRSIVNYKN